jgi:tRNA U34 5-carboxymethylaminomethyl modifying GTPase MnmE/TrmE
MLKVIAIALCGVVTAITTQIDLLTAQALTNLEAHLAINGQPNVEKCTLENAAVRREWFVAKKLYD